MQRQIEVQRPVSERSPGCGSRGRRTHDIPCPDIWSLGFGVSGLGLRHVQDRYGLGKTETARQRETERDGEKERVCEYHPYGLKGSEMRFACFLQGRIQHERQNDLDVNREKIQDVTIDKRYKT
jgi:hypothetical protein